MTSDPEAESRTVEREGGRIVVTLRGRFGGTISGWPEAREDLGLNKHGDPVEGVELVGEIDEYHDPGDEYPYGQSEVRLAFEDVEAVRRAADHLFDKATERFEWGDASGGEDVQTIAGRLPHRSEVPEP